MRLQWRPTCMLTFLPMDEVISFEGAEINQAKETASLKLDRVKEDCEVHQCSDYANC